MGRTVTLTRACSTNGCMPGALPSPAAGLYYDGALTAPNAGTLPASCTLACTYEENIGACSPTPISCDTTSTTSQVGVDTSNACIQYETGTFNAASCLTHQAIGADQINVTGPPATIPPQFLAGSGNPLVANSVVNSGDQVTASSSIVTIPVVATTPLPLSGPLNVVGFVQAFVNSVTINPLSGKAETSVTVMNISGCGTTPGRTGNPVLGDTVSPVPVRLVQN